MKRFFGECYQEAIKITEERMQDALPWGSALFCGGGEKIQNKDRYSQKNIQIDKI